MNLDKNALIRKDDARYEAITTGNAYAHSYRDTGGSSLLIFLVFIITICLLSAPIFEKTGWFLFFICLFLLFFKDYQSFKIRWR